MNRMTPVLLFALLAMTVAAPQGSYYSTTPIPILRSVTEGPNADGSYNWEFETGNGIRAAERGQLQNSKYSNEPSIVAQGSYSYTADDGTPISVSYIADENGFQPQGAHFPVPPPIPEGIARALEHIALHPEEDHQ